MDRRLLPGTLSMAGAGALAHLSRHATLHRTLLASDEEHARQDAAAHGGDSDGRSTARSRRQNGRTRPDPPSLFRRLTALLVLTDTAQHKWGKVRVCAAAVLSGLSQHDRRSEHYCTLPQYKASCGSTLYVVPPLVASTDADTLDADVDMNLMASIRQNTLPLYA